MWTLSDFCPTTPDLKQFWCASWIFDCRYLMFAMSVTTMVVMNCVIVLNVSLRTPNTHIMTDKVRKVRLWVLANPWGSHWINVLVYLPLDYPLTLRPPQILLNILPRLLRMQMQPWTPNNEYTPEAGNSKTLATERHLVPCRRRSSITLITKAEEYVMKTARSELMFTRLKERNGLMKSVLEKLRKFLNEFACVKAHRSRLVSLFTFRKRLF